MGERPRPCGVTDSALVESDRSCSPEPPQCKGYFAFTQNLAHVSALCDSNLESTTYFREESWRNSYTVGQCIRTRGPLVTS